jgi:hypothetical protein
MNTGDGFKHDVAFSFVAADEPRVRELNALLTGPLDTFYYAEHQKTLDHGRRLARTLEQRGLENEFQNSERGVGEMKKEAETLKTEVVRLIEQLHQLSAKSASPEEARRSPCVHPSAL